MEVSRIELGLMTPNKCMQGVLWPGLMRMGVCGQRNSYD